MSIADKAHTPALLIDGEDVAATATRTVRDPATGEPIAEVADATQDSREPEAGTVWINDTRKDWYDAVSTPEDS